VVTAADDCATSVLVNDVLFFHLCENLAGSLVMEGHSEVVAETDVTASDCNTHAQWTQIQIHFKGTYVNMDR